MPVIERPTLKPRGRQPKSSPLTVIPEERFPRYHISMIKLLVECTLRGMVSHGTLNGHNAIGHNVIRVNILVYPTSSAKRTHSLIPYQSRRFGRTDFRYRPTAGMGVPVLDCSRAYTRCTLAEEADWSGECTIMIAIRVWFEFFASLAFDIRPRYIHHMMVSVYTHSRLLMFQGARSLP